MANYYNGPQPRPAGMPLPGEHRGAYGSFNPPQQQPKFGGNGTAFIAGQRRRMNLVAVAMALFVPWLLFCAVFAVMSFSFHYQQPASAYFILAIALLVPVATGVFAADAARRKAAGDPTRQPTWFVFMFITSLLAWILGFVFGDMNFYQNMRPFYDVLNLNTYPSVDPSKMRGQQLMDAGRMVFTPEAKLDLSRSMGFKNLDLYCVAPVTVGNANASSVPLATYDFWAVGVNCCSGSQADFHCGEFSNPNAHAGLRLMRDDERPFFRLAVQQAEAAYSIKAVHPLFLYWMEDPIAEVNAYRDDGFRSYLIGMFAFFALQLFLTACAMIAFSKMGHY